jgi:hypothetical protein
MLNQLSNADFLEWFRASGAGNLTTCPLPLFHGTDIKLSELRPSMRGLYGAGIYLTPYSGNAQEYGRYVVKVVALIQAPLLGTHEQLRAMRIPGELDTEFTDRLKHFGYDGIIVQDAWGEPYTVVAFESCQVQTANQSIWADAPRTAVMH